MTSEITIKSLFLFVDFEDSSYVIFWKVSHDFTVCIMPQLHTVKVVSMLCCCCWHQCSTFYEQILAGWYQHICYGILIEIELSCFAQTTHTFTTFALFIW